MTFKLEGSKTFAALFWGAFGLCLLYIFYVLFFDSGPRRSIPELVRFIKIPRAVSPYYRDTFYDGACEQLGAKGPQALPAEVELMKDPHASTRFCGLIAINELGPELAKAASTQPELASLVVTVLKDDPNSFGEVVQALKFLGTQAESAKPPLIFLLKNVKPYVRLQAAAVLVQLGGSSTAAAVAVLAELAGHQTILRSDALIALRNMGPRLADFIAGEPRLLPAVEASMNEYSEPPNRREAVGIFRNLGPAAAGSAPALKKLLGNKDPWISASAREALDVIAMECPGQKGQPR